MGIDIGEVVQSYLPDDMPADHKGLVSEVIAGMDPMAILQLVADAQIVKSYLDSGETEKARAILQTHREKAATAGPAILAAFDAMFDSL